MAKTCIFYWRNSVHFIIPLTQREIVAEIEKIEREMQTLENEIADAETQKMNILEKYLK